MNLCPLSTPEGKVSLRSSMFDSLCEITEFNWKMLVSLLGPYRASSEENTPVRMGLLL